MPRTASPRPTFVYRVDHALRVSLKVKHYVQPINDPEGEALTTEITTWEYVVNFGSGKRALFKGADFVTFHSSPDVAVVELIRALDESMVDRGFDVNAVQLDWIINGSKGYDYVKDVSDITDVPGATVEVYIHGANLSGTVPVDEVTRYNPVTGDVFIADVVDTLPDVPAETLPAWMATSGDGR